MKEKKIYQRLIKEATLPIEPDSQRLLDALGLSLPERQEASAPKPRRIWLPAVAISCTAAIAIGVCVPIYLNLQGQTAIIEPGGQTSSTAEGKRKLVSGFDIQTECSDCTISRRLQEEMDNPENKDALFRVKIDCPGWPSDDYLYQGESYLSICNARDEIVSAIVNQYGVMFTDKIAGVWSYLPDDWRDNGYWAQDYLYELEKDPDFIAQRQKLFDCEDKVNACIRQYHLETNAYLAEMGITIEPVIENAHDREEPDCFYATLTREQIELLDVKYDYLFCLALPPRPEGYDRRIADTLAMALEQDDGDTYQVMVYTTICKDISEAYWYNADLIRQLSGEETTQEFGDNFLADIRKRHGIEDQYLPDYRLHHDGTTHLVEDWVVWQNEYGEWYYQRGRFKAELTKAQILELAQDSDIRAIYLSDTDPEYAPFDSCPAD